MRRQKSFMKQFLLLILCVSMSVLLIACGGSGTTSSGSASEEAAETTENTNDNKEAQTEVPSSDGTSVIETDSTNAAVETTAVSEELAAETDVATLNTDEEGGLDPSIQYKEGEEKIFDSDHYSITVTGYDPKYHIPLLEDGEDLGSDYFAISILFENKSDFLFTNEWENKAAVNRVMTGAELADGEGEAINSFDDLFSRTSGFEVPAGETKKALILLNLDPLIFEGITSVDEVIFELNGGFWEDDVVGLPVQDVMTMYPTGKNSDEIIPTEKIMEKNVKDNTMIVADQENLQAGIMCRDTEEGSLFGICFYNKTDKVIKAALEDVYVNGVEYCDTSEGEKSQITIEADLLPGCYNSDTLLWSFIEENELTEIKELKAKLVVVEESDNIDSPSYDIMYEGEIVNSEDIDWKP